MCQVEKLRAEQCAVEVFEDTTGECLTCCTESREVCESEWVRKGDVQVKADAGQQQRFVVEELQTGPLVIALGYVVSQWIRRLRGCRVVVRRREKVKWARLRVGQVGVDIDYASRGERSRRVLGSEVNGGC